jgi:signal-transduction protein with cAMP-binding, CBS, and nucleotidyltransferase domain
MHSPPHLAAPPEALDDPPISSVMTPERRAIAPDSPLRTALRLMASGNVRHLPVIEGSRCLGLVAGSPTQALSSSRCRSPCASRTSKR